MLFIFVYLLKKSFLIGTILRKTNLAIYYCSIIIVQVKRNMRLNLPCRLCQLISTSGCVALGVFSEHGFFSWEFWKTLCLFPLWWSGYISLCHVVVPHVHILSAGESPAYSYVMGSHWQKVSLRYKSAPGGYEGTIQINLLMHLSFSCQKQTLHFVTHDKMQSLFLVSPGVSPVHIGVIRDHVFLEQRFLVDIVFGSSLLVESHTVL